MKLTRLHSASFLLLAVCTLALSLSAGPSITVDHVEGLDAYGGIYPGAILTFHMRITGDANAHYVISNGFRISGENVSWTTMTGALNPVYPWDLSYGFPCFFDLGMFVNAFSTGSGADTIGFGGAAGMYGTGLPAGFDDVAYTITIGPLQGTEYAFLELDSAFYRPAGRWVWDIVEENVEWGGPYVFAYCEGCGSPEPETYLEQDPIILKDLADRVLRVYVANEDVGSIDLSSVVVQGKIPPYTAARIEGDLLVTDVFMFRFLSTWRPISSDVQGAYTISYTKYDGSQTTLLGDVNIQVYPGDLNFDGVEDQQDVVYLVDYIWQGANAPVLEEALDVNRDGYVDVRDLRELVNLIF